MEINEKELAAELVRGSEDVKRQGIEESQTHTKVAFRGLDRVPTSGCLPKDTTWSRTGLKVPTNFIVKCLDDHLVGLMAKNKRKNDAAPFDKVLLSAKKECKRLGLDGVKVLLSGNSGRCEHTYKSSQPL